jgi:hypothetical protein
MSARHRLASSTSGGPTHLDRRQGKAQPLPSCYATEYTGTGGYVPSFEANTTQGISTIWRRIASEPKGWIWQGSLVLGELSKMQLCCSLLGST